MPITPLEHAIALIKQGKHAEAQKSLKSLIAEDQHNLKAWFWLVETCTTNKQRINILEMCLDFNPDNQQVKHALEKLRALSSAQLSTTLPKSEEKRSLETSEGKYKALIKLSIVSAFLLVVINYLLAFLAASSQDVQVYVLFLAFVLPWTPLLSLPATAIVYSIYSKRHKSVFFVVGIPLIFNVLGASVLNLPYLIDPLMRLISPPPTVSLTGKFSDKLGAWYGEKSLDVSVGVTTDQAGDFSIGAQLISGNQVISTSNTSVSLVPGDNIVTIQFLGEDIRHYRLDGPYQVKVLPIVDVEARDWQTSGYIPVKNNIWQTAAYHWRDFGGELCFALVASIQPNPSVATMEISPAPNCLNGQYLSATRVTLKVTPKPGFQLRGWGGDTGGVDIHSPIITIPMQRNMVANAFFEPKP